MLLEGDTEENEREFFNVYASEKKDRKKSVEYSGDNEDTWRENSWKDTKNTARDSATRHGGVRIRGRTETLDRAKWRRIIANSTLSTGGR